MVAMRDPVIKRGLPLRSATKKLSVPLIRLELMAPIKIIPMKKKETIARFMNVLLCMGLMELHYRFPRQIEFAPHAIFLSFSSSPHRTESIFPCSLPPSPRGRGRGTFPDSNP
jgi:hypothetical protein